MGKIACSKSGNCEYRDGRCVPVANSVEIGVLRSDLEETEGGIFPPEVLAEYGFVRQLTRVNWWLMSLRVLEAYVCKI